MVSINTENLITLHESPRMYSIKNFLSDVECTELITAALEKGLYRSRIGYKNINNYRTSESVTVKRDWLSKKIEDLLPGHGSTTQEDPEITRYLSGQEFKEHCDAEPYHHNQRIATILVYLNTVDEGGATYFTKLNLRIKPEKGTAVIFFPSKPDGNRDDLLEHSAEPAIDEKWVSQIWVHDRPNEAVRKVVNKIEINSDV